MVQQTVQITTEQGQPLGGTLFTRCAFRIKKSKLITYHNDIIQFSPKNQNNE